MFNSNCHNYNSIFVLLHLILSFSIFQVVNSFCDCGYRGLRHPNTFSAVCLFFDVQQQYTGLSCIQNQLKSQKFSSQLLIHGQIFVSRWFLLINFCIIGGGQVNLTWLSILITSETKRFLEM